MSAAATTITINRCVEDVFAVLTNLDNAAKWSQAKEEQLITPGPLGVGSRRRAVVPTVGGRTRENVMELTEFEPNRRMAMRGISGFPFPLRALIQLEPVGDSTRLEWTTFLEPRGLMRPFGPLLAAWFKRLFAGDLRNLKAMMETGRL